MKLARSVAKNTTLNFSHFVAPQIWRRHGGSPLHGMAVSPAQTRASSMPSRAHGPHLQRSTHGETLSERVHPFASRREHSLATSGPLGYRPSCWAMILCLDTASSWGDGGRTPSCRSAPQQPLSWAARQAGPTGDRSGAETRERLRQRRCEAHHRCWGARPRTPRRVAPQNPGRWSPAGR